MLRRDAFGFDLAGSVASLWSALGLEGKGKSGTWGVLGKYSPYSFLILYMEVFHSPSS